jgi:hypothetical protein
LLGRQRGILGYVSVGIDDSHASLPLTVAHGGRDQNWDWAIARTLPLFDVGVFVVRPRRLIDRRGLIKTAANADGTPAIRETLGVDRPGIGSSTPYQYGSAVEFADDLRTIPVKAISLVSGAPKRSCTP